MKQTYAALANKYGVDERTVRGWRDNGIDVQDESAVEMYLLTLNDNNVSESLDEDDFDGSDINKDSFITMKFEKLIHETALKKAEATLKQLEVSKRKGELVPMSDVCEVNLLVASKVRAQLKAMTLSLPPKLEGTDIRTMVKILDEEFRNIMEYLSGELNIEDEE